MNPIMRFLLNIEMNHKTGLIDLNDNLFEYLKIIFYGNMKLLKVVYLLKNAKNLKILELLLKILMIFIAIFQIIINKNLNKKKKK